jgi:hypothetical protein
MTVIGIPNLAAQEEAPAQVQVESALGKADNSFGVFNAVPTLSTEARYSAGVFGSYVDDFIDVNGYDPKTGAFFFLGGFPAEDYVEKTDYLATSTGGDPDYALSAGFAKGFDRFYLGTYFGGTLVSAKGEGNKDAKTTNSEAAWDAKLAVLFGAETIGGIRLDLILDGITDKKSTYDGETISPNGTETTGQGASLAVSWGKNLAIGDKELPVHAMLGFKFPDYTLQTDAQGDSKTETFTDARLLISGGASYGLNDISTLVGNLYVGGDFGKTTTGEQKATTKGDFGFKLEAALANAISPAAGLEIGFKPNLAIGVWGSDPDVSGDADVDADATTSFELAAGIDAGLKAQLPGTFNKFTLITGASLKLFDWQTTGTSGGDSGSEGQSAWTVEGVSWDKDSLTEGGALGIGTVLAPNDNLSIGFGLSTLLNNLIKVNIVEMKVEPGEFFTEGQPGITGGETGPFGKLFNDVTFDLTVSYKF